MTTASPTRFNGKARRRPKLPMLCMDWSESSVEIALVGMRDSRPIVMQQWHLERVEGPILGAAPDEVGRWLAGQFREQEIPKRPVYVSIPRRQVVLKTFLQDNVAARDFTEAVLLQAESQYPMPLDQLVVDFVAQPAVDDRQSLVLAAAVAETTVVAIEAMMDAASLELKGIGLGELGLGRTPNTERATAMQLVVYAGEFNLELLAFRGGVPFLTQSLLVPSGEQELKGAIEKLIDHFKSRVEEFGLASGKSIYLRGPRASVIRPLFESRFDEILFEDEQSLRCLGLAQQFQHPESTVDFLSPRRPPDRTAARRRNIILATGVLLVASAALFAWLQATHDRLDRKLAERREQLDEIEKRLAGQQSTFDSVRAIQDWKDSRVEWSREISQVLDRLGDNERVYLERLQVESLTESTELNAQITGLARQSQDVLSAADRFVSDERAYAVTPGAIRPSGRDRYYRSSFDLGLRWPREQNSEATDVED